ncbi:MAG: hypothetical protein QOF33_4799 [Thermomicrobiales bacterium]|nr:hypothetical protein [Thermomicrobiales bacterium]MEA2524661.1 hypothetical protein [Thermomicrobiales bacterium]MEA2532109.1 hypothetical protein [Thermomicrobiales bacterium]MEA2586714.1 hypothetical protein [Thermomicrobiales bacterium]MEA2598834.1 hypothetical protein [Thermomicrobiales bacterium]
MEQAIQPGRISNGDDMLANDFEGHEDQLAFFAGLRLALPLGLGMWAVLAWGVVHFLF